VKPKYAILLLKRQRFSNVEIVSGLVGHYLPEELVNKKVIIVKNLKSAKLRGVESQGMLLAADEKDKVEVIFPEKSEIGEKVVQKAKKNNPKPLITIKDFQKIKIEVKDYQVVSDGIPLTTKNEELKLKNIKEGNVG